MEIQAAYWPLLSQGKKLIVLSARGDGGYGPGGPLADANLVEASLRVPLAYIGITEFWSVAVEWDEFADARVAQSLLSAEADIDALVAQLAPLRRTESPERVLAPDIHAD